MRHSLLAVTLLASAVLAASTASPTALSPSPAFLSARHGDDADEGEGEGESAAGHASGMTSHEHEHGHDHGGSGSSMSMPFNASSLYGPDGEVLEPIPGLNAPMPQHHHHGASTPLTSLDEEDILRSHKPNPLSYWTHDYVFDADDERLQGGGQHGGWIVFGHGLAMVVSFLFILPLALAFRTAKSPLYVPTLFASNTLSFISVFCAWVYRLGTPDLYAHDSHKPMGYIVLALYYALGAFDIFRLVRDVPGGWKAKLLSLVGVGPSARAAEESRARFAEYGFLPSSVEPKANDDSAYHEEGGQVVFKLEDDDEEEVQLSTSPSAVSPADRRPTPSYINTSPSYFLSEEPSPTSSTSTLHHHHHHDPHSALSSSLVTGEEREQSNLARAQSRAETFLWRITVVLGYACTVTGITVFAGACRAQYINGCMAHLIKGSIFFGYGILTFGRYLGAWQEYGWAWNIRPRRRSHPGSKSRKSGWSVPSAEAVESGVIFLYGITNTWLERLGAKPGSPYTIHQVQHISIAVMFWFCGALGLLLELPAAKRFLSNSVLRLDGRRLADVSKPPSWTGSFNPFPALVIAVTGLAMSAHHQGYVLAIEVHTLWGNLLALFGVLRIATYVFLWLRPPRSILPSRPPTEALASFALCCGGFVFILSTEQVVFGAMRSGWDSIMAFLTVTISLVAIIFCWTFVVLCAKGWAIERRTGFKPSNRDGVQRSDSTRTEGSDDGDDDQGRVRLPSTSI